MNKATIAATIGFLLVSLGLANPVAAKLDGPVPFAAAQDISGGAVSGLSAMDAQDLDGDGYTDIVTMEGGKHAGGRVTFAWFQAPQTAVGGTWTRHDFNRPASMTPFIGAVRLGDVDGDGDYDIVFAMDNHSGATRVAHVMWMENPRPAGKATGNWPIRTVEGPMSVHHINDMDLADMDGDKKLDIVVRDLEPNQLHVYFQNSKTSWTAKVIATSAYGADGEGFAIGNLDGAGQNDISINGYWLQAPADPRTQSYKAFTIDGEYSKINQNTKEAIGDLDGDGRPDVVISPAEGYRNGGNHILAWYKAPPHPTASSSWTRTILKSDFNGGHTVRLADMDGDGDLDIVSAVAWSQWGQTQNVTIYYNLEAGKFGNAQTVVTGKGLYSGVVRDLGKDGDLDIIGPDVYSSTSRPYIYTAIGGAPTGGGKEGSK